MNIAEMTNKISEDIHEKLESYLKRYSSEVKGTKICFEHKDYCRYFRGTVLGLEVYADNIRIENEDGLLHVVLDPKVCIKLKDADYEGEIGIYELAKMDVLSWHNWQGDRMDKCRYLSIFY